MKKRSSDIENKAGRPKSELKRNNILQAATDLFLQHGFSQTSMDLVANTAGVSKQTVYSHFSNKDALFSAVIELKCSEYQLDPEHMEGDELQPRDVMIRIGDQFVSLLKDPQAVAMYRVVIGEATNTPHVAELFYLAGPKYGIDSLSQFMRNNTYLNLNENDAYYWSVAFFNMLKSEFHMLSLFGLPFNLDKDQQLEGVTKTTDNVLKMIHSDN